jgi:hypothetical protein
MNRQFIVQISSILELRIALSYFNNEGPFIDLHGLALVWDRDGAAIYEVPLEIWRSEESPVKNEWLGRWA